MKKIFLIFTSVILLLSIFILSACSSNVFKGNYKEVSEEEKVQLLNDFKDSSTQDITEKGFKLSIKITTLNDKKQNSLTYNLKSKLDENNKMSLSGDFEVSNQDDINIKANIYYIDEVLYSDSSSKISGTTIETKTKKKIQFDINKILSLSDSKLNLEDFNFESVIEDSKGKISIDKSNNSTKIKIDSQEEENKGEFYFIFNKENKVTAVKINSTSKINNVEITTSFVIEPYTGKISVPSNLDEYKSSIL